MIVFLIAIIRWTYYDAAERDFELWRYFFALMVVFPGPLIMMPLYFILSRGWAAGLIMCGYAVAFVLLQYGIDFASTSLAFQLFWAD